MSDCSCCGPEVKLTNEEKIAKLEGYQKELKKESEGVEIEIKKLKKK